MPIIKKHQNIIDFTAQHAGDIAGLFDTAVANGRSITGDIDPGTELAANVVNAKVVNDLVADEVDVVSDPVIEAGIPGGIGYMQIGSSFKVS